MRARADGPVTAQSLALGAQLKAEVRAPAARLEDLATLLPSALQGRGELALAARAEGTPRSWRGTGTLTSPLVELGPGPLRGLRAAFNLDGTRVDVTELSCRCVRHAHPCDGHVGLGGRGKREGDARPGAAHRPRDGTGRCRPARNRASHPRGRGALPSRCHGHGSRRPRRRRRRQPLARSRAVRRHGARRSVSRRAGLPRAALACERRRAHRHRRSPPRRGGRPRHRSRASHSRARAGSRHARRHALGPGHGPGAARRAAPRRRRPPIDPVRLVVAGDTWASQGPTQFAGHRVASPWPSSGSPRRTRASSPDRQPLA